LETARLYSGETEYVIEICGLTRSLPIRKVGAEMWIASNHNLVLGRDTRFTEAAATELASLIKKYEPEHLLTAETKSLPLVYEISKRLSLSEMLVTRKNAKAYADKVKKVPVKSITTTEPQTLFFEYENASDYLGTRIAPVDDVVSTGGTMDALEALVKMLDAQLACKAAIWLEGPWYRKEGLVYLGTLPVWATGKTYEELKRIEAADKKPKPSK